MKLYIIRHGEALSPDVDPERGLSDEGRRQADRLGAFLQEKQVHVPEIWHSPKARAQQTAQLVQASGDLGGTLIEKAGLLPNDSVEAIAIELEAIDTDVCIVGHLPFVERLSAALTGQSSSHFVFDTCAACCLEREGSGNWAVRWMLSPPNYS